MTFGEGFDALDSNRWKHGWACGAPQPPTCFFQTRFETHYTPANAVVADGFLRIATRREAAGGKMYTSGALTTAGRWSQQYGYFEARIKPHSGQGNDPAFWLATIRAWPPEIDIAEFPGFHEGRVLGNPILHAAGMKDQPRLKRLTAPASWNDAFHVVGLYWEPGRIVGFVDGQTTGEITAGVPDEPLHIVLSDEVRKPDGNWFGDPTKGTFPRTTLVDWVRVWERTEASTMTAAPAVPMTSTLAMSIAPMMSRTRP
jgi:beta-glucanase (GH16 family)